MSRDEEAEPVFGSGRQITKRPQQKVSQFVECCKKVRQAIRLIQSDGIRKEDLLKNLEYTVELMEAIISEEEIDIIDEGELSVNTDAVPIEIRDWLTSTFSTSVCRPVRAHKAPRFRAVANAIRAGIMVEKGNHSYKINIRVTIKMFKRSNEIAAMKIPTEVAKFMKAHVNDWSFPIFELDDMTDGHALKTMGLDLFLRHNVFHKFKVKLNNYEALLDRLEEGYSRYHNPYHNLVHGADVAQTCHYIIYTYQLQDNWLTDLESFATVFAALIHDYEHTGTTNNFHINTSSKLSLLYNDRGVLENHHVSSVFRIMQDPECDILHSLDKNEFKEFRSVVIEMVLNTDMSTHFKQMKNMKSHLSMDETVEKAAALSLVLHCADISHPGKHWDLHHRWTMQLLEEFFRQGDKERDLSIPFSPLCDRKSILIPESQIGFSNFIVDPSFQILGSMLEQIVSQLRKTGFNITVSVDEKLKPTDTYKVLRANETNSKFTLDGMPNPWDDFITVNRSYWQKKLDQEKEAKEIQQSTNKAEKE